jgi:hypothetical protein
MDQKGEESEEKKKHPKAPLREGGASRSEQQKGEWERGGSVAFQMRRRFQKRCVGEKLGAEWERERMRNGGGERKREREG